MLLKEIIGSGKLCQSTSHSQKISYTQTLVPCILTNCHYIRVVLYDCVNDVLLITDLRDDRDDISKGAILLLWLFINHRYIHKIVLVLIIATRNVHYCIT